MSMDIQTKEFSFRGGKVTGKPFEYRVEWNQIFEGTPLSRITIGNSDGDRLMIYGEDFSKFIKELQTLHVFMKVNELLPQEEGRDENM